MKDEKDAESRVMSMIHQEIKCREAHHEKEAKKLGEMHDVEMMHADALESLVPSLNEEHAQSQSESQVTIK